MLFALIAILLAASVSGEAGRCEMPLSVVLLLDGSGSILTRQFELMRRFSLSLVGAFNPHPPSTAVGVVQFATSSRTVSPLSTNKSSVDAALIAMNQINGGTDIGGAIASSVTSAFDSYHPAGVLPKNYLFIFTDGQSSGTPGVQSKALQAAHNVTVFAIGIGEHVDVQQLERVASAPVGDHVFLAANFSALESLITPLLSSACADLTGVNPSNGSSDGGDAVLVTGHGFSSPMLVRVGMKEISNVRVLNNGEAILNSPSAEEAGASTGAPSVPVSVSFDGGMTWVSNGTVDFTYTFKGGCPGNCSGHGVCVGNTCYCNSGWAPPACDHHHQACPGNGNCNGHGTCNQDGTCTCDMANGGWMGLGCTEQSLFCCVYCSNKRVAANDDARINNPAVVGTQCSSLQPVDYLLEKFWCNTTDVFKCMRGQAGMKPCFNAQEYCDLAPQPPQ